MANGNVYSFQVATTLAVHRIVSSITATAYGVQYPVSITALPIGVTIDTVIDTTNSIPVQLDGVAACFFNDTVGSGELVASDTSGRAIPFSLAMTSTGISAPSAYAGQILGASVAATGAIQEILIRPGFDRVSA